MSAPKLILDKTPDLPHLLINSWKKFEETKAILTPPKYSVRQLDGKYKFQLIINESRFKSKRKGFTFRSVKEPLNPEAFNFNRIKDDEVLLSASSGKMLGRLASHPNGVVGSDDQSNNRSVESEIVVNATPIVEYHYMIVCNRKLCIPQHVDQYSIKTCIELGLESDGRFTIGFNGQCASSTVNHQHYQLFCDFQVPIPALSYVHSPQPTTIDNIYLVDDFVFPFLFIRCHTDPAPEIINFIAKFSDMLTDLDFTYNILIKAEKDPSSVNILYFPRKIQLETNTYDHSFLGFSGTYVVSEEQAKTMTEKSLIAFISRFSFNRNQILDLLQKYKDMTKRSPLQPDKRTSDEEATNNPPC